MLHFTIFNIPVRIQPLFWLGAFIIGGGFAIQGRDGLIATLLAIAAILVSILVHELGHALTSRKLTRVTPDIELMALGGLARPNTQLSPRESFLVTWAGPLAGFALFLLAALGLAIFFGLTAGLHFAALLTFPWVEGKLSDLTILSQLNPYTIRLLSTFLWVNFWWSALNLLPIFPLDGGQIYASMEPSTLKVSRVGMITGGLAALAFLTFGLFIGAMLFGFLAFQNYQRMQAINGSGSFR